ncbi:MAG: hypothetical protein ACXWFS_05960 [Thermoanaerobaculia bacterium]
MKTQTRIVSGLAALAALFLAPLAEASLTRPGSPILEAPAPAITLPAPAPEPSEFSLFVGDELTRDLGAPRASAEAGRFHPLAAVSLLSKDGAEAPLVSADPSRFPKTRIGVFDFLGSRIIGVERELSLELQWGSGRFGLKTSEGIGIWLSQDPAGDKDSPNLYGFVGGRPHERTDPLGLQARLAPPPPLLEPLPEVVPPGQVRIPGHRPGQVVNPNVPRYAPGMPSESFWNFRAALEAARRARPPGAGSPALGGRTVDELTEKEREEFLEHRRRMKTDPVYRGQVQGLRDVIARLHRPSAAGAGGGGDDGDPPGTYRDVQGRLHDAATGQFVEDPLNPRSPYAFNDAQRRAEWKRIAQDPNSPLAPEQRAQVQARGWRGPQRVNQDTGEMETMELSHEPIPRREGGSQVIPRWPDEHAAVDPYRQLPKNR